MNMKKLLSFFMIICLIGFYSCKQQTASESPNSDLKKVQTRIGELEFSHDFENGYPTDETVEKLYDEMDFQRACQAYLWGLPLVSIAQWHDQHQTVFNAEDGDLVIYTTYKDKQGILTANVTTPYIFTFVDLTKSGPMVVELQPGPSASGILNQWQYAVTDMGTLGPDKNEGGRYLVLPPGSEISDVEGYHMVHMNNNIAWIGFRSLIPEPEKALDWIKTLKIYPYSEKDNPSATKFINADSKDWSHVQPRGIAYWERLAEAINAEVVQSHDRVQMASLRYLGIEKGKEFNPTVKQRKILEEASIVGEAMAKANSFDKRFDGAYYRHETH